MIVAGTGHRPDKLGGYGPEVSTRLIVLARDWLIAYKPERVISGGALGWDQALAWAAQSTDIPYTMALPFEGFEKQWPKSSQDDLARLLDKAHEIVDVSEPGYAPWKMQVRNQWMVDHCDQVLALWNGSKGGTGNCIAYANKVGKPIVNLWDAYNG